MVRKSKRCSAYVLLSKPRSRFENLLTYFQWHYILVLKRDSKPEKHKVAGHTIEKPTRELMHVNGKMLSI